MNMVAHQEVTGRVSDQDIQVMVGEEIGSETCVVYTERAVLCVCATLDSVSYQAFHPLTVRWQQELHERGVQPLFDAVLKCESPNQVLAALEAVQTNCQARDLIIGVEMAPRAHIQTLEQAIRFVKAALLGESWQAALQRIQQQIHQCLLDCSRLPPGILKIIVEHVDDHINLDGARFNATAFNDDINADRARTCRGGPTCCML